MTKILLLEDDVSLIDGLEYALRKNGFDIETIRTVSGAIERMRLSVEYDLLLLDVTLPDGTGFDVCEKVRAAGSQIPIIFLTAADEEVNVIRGLDIGGDDYITKPFKIGELTNPRAVTAHTIQCKTAGLFRASLDGLCGKPRDDGRNSCGADAGRIPSSQPARAKY